MGQKIVRSNRFSWKLRKFIEINKSKNSDILQYYVNEICEILIRKSLNGTRFIRIFKTPSGRRMILDIFWIYEEDERPPMAKRMDASAQFSRDQLPRMT